MTWPWWAGVLAAAPWFAAPLLAFIIGRPRPRLRRWKPLTERGAPPVSIVVPARNEEANLERCLRSLLASRYPDFEIVVVDDRSTDRTRAIAEKLAATDHRVIVLDGQSLPEGWYGKPWACWQGYLDAKGDVLLFTDADTEHGPDLLGRAVAALESERADMVTVMPLQEMRGFWERVAQPFFFISIGLRYGTPERQNRNRDPRHAIANGQFILTTRDAYEWVGGHRKVRNTVVEDLQLAVEYARAARKMFFVMADEDMATRMYRSLGGIVEGWSKNFFMGVMATFPSRPLATLVALGSLSLPLFFLAPPALAVAGHLYRIPAAAAFGVAAYLGSTLLVAHILAASRQHPLWALFHPLGALVQALVILRATLRGTSRIEWKGRTYSQSEVDGR